MKIKCDWCGNWINDFDQTCPSCGGVNSHYKRQADGIPRTIEELKAWAAAHNLPLEQMRTYIGEDYRGPRAFGIYKDESTGTFVVYKNKDDGSRAIRYQGNDEAYAVNELYMKMKERVAQQKSHMTSTSDNNSYPNNDSGDNHGKKKMSTLKKALITIGVVMILSQMLPSIIMMVTMWSIQHAPASPSTGYYTYNSEPYYYYRGDWYEWADDHWAVSSDAADWMENDYSEYYDSYTYDDSSSYSDFEESPYYDKDSSDSDDSNNDSGWSYGNDWDSDSNWDSNDDWDSGWDDWDSDW